MVLEMIFKLFQKLPSGLDLILGRFATRIGQVLVEALDKVGLMCCECRNGGDDLRSDLLISARGKWLGKRSKCHKKERKRQENPSDVL